ncbi:hypothetical protein OAK75_11375 [Bacteriovoracales bacterium]|nr:hypothetical protein [Bacteriovoracales bacterium]
MRLLIIVCLLVFSCSSSKKNRSRQGRCVHECAEKWERSVKSCKNETGVKKEVCLKHTYWKLNDWM